MQKSLTESQIVADIAINRQGLSICPQQLSLTPDDIVIQYLDVALQHFKDEDVT